MNAVTFEDFSRADNEKLDLSRIDAIAGTLPNDAFTFSGAAGDLRWEEQGTARTLQGNSNSDVTDDLTIFVKDAGPVESTWFVL